MIPSPATSTAATPPSDTVSFENAILGTLIGTAVGDSLGLPMEGLSPARQRRLFPGALRHRLIGHFGLTSDDTEHTFLLAQALLESPGDAHHFQRTLARKLRWWLLALPAGVGFATLRAILKLWIGFPPRLSGIYSAGNGPAMRSALLGVLLADHDQRRQFVQASSEITHRDPRANLAALAIAETARWMMQRRSDIQEFTASLIELSSLTEWRDVMTKLHRALQAGMAVPEFAREIGGDRGVSGYALRSVPVAIFAALRHAEDFDIALEEAIACGGDTDTVGAMVGAMVGARVGADGIPQQWQAGIVEWPRRKSLFPPLAQRLASRSKADPIAYCWPATPLRNLAFLLVVLAHGLRRLLPPY